jgi:ribonuclease P protein component
MIDSLKGKKNFSDVYKHGISFYEKPAKAIVCFSSEPCLKHCSEKVLLGVSVSKRTAKKAVVRNRIKRLLRESVSHVAKENNKDCFRGLQSVILIWYYAPSKPALISLKDVLPVVQKIFDRICCYINDKNISVKK